MIGVRLTLGDIAVVLTCDAPYSPDIVDDMTTVARRTILATNAGLADDADDDEVERLDWNAAMRRDMMLDD